MEHETVAVVSDIHANRPALEVVLDDIDDRGIETILCLGDIVGILGWNVEVVELVQEHADYVVFGNHDARIRPDFAYAPSFPAARDEHRIVTEQLNEEHVEWLSELPDRIATDEFVMAHSRPFYMRDPGYPCHGFAQGDRGVTKGDFTRYGPYLDGRAAFIGHTHDAVGLDCSPFQGQDGLLLNPGSVGVPWYEPASYATVDLSSHDFEHHRIEYDYSMVEDQLEAQGTPVGKYSNNKRLYNTTK